MAKDHSDHGGCHQPGEPHGMGGLGRKAEQAVPGLLGPDSSCRRQGSGRIYVQDPGEDEAGDGCGVQPPSWLGPEQPLERGMGEGLEGQGVLVRAGADTCFELDGPWSQRKTPLTYGGVGRGLHERRAQSSDAGDGEDRVWRHLQPSEQDERKKGGEKEESERRQGRTEPLSARFKRWRKVRREGGQRIYFGRGVLCLEQQERALRKPSTWREMQREGGQGPQVFNLWESRPSFERLHPKEGLDGWDWFWLLVACPGGASQSGGGAGDGHRGKDKDEGVQTGKEMAKGLRSRSRRLRHTGKDPEDPEDPPEGKIHVKGAWMTLEDYTAYRPFTFVHHYCGKVDNLGIHIEAEASDHNMNVTVVSIDKEMGYDLRADRPYKYHIEQAGEGRIDGYHSGFPCSTFSRLRWRQAPGLPGPVRSKDFPYGFKNMDPVKVKEADDGTVMMARSCMMVSEQYKADRCMVVSGFSTLENPPPSEVPEHISAWHMPEMVDLLDGIPEFKCAHYHTCAFEEDIPMGERHYKPGTIGGTLPGIEGLARRCNCGGRPHEPIVGKEKSAKSAAYPDVFCREYAKLAIAHFKKMAHAEFLEGRLEALGRNIEKNKRKAEEFDKETLDLVEDIKKYQCTRSYRDGEEHLKTVVAAAELARRQKEKEEAKKATEAESSTGAAASGDLKKKVEEAAGPAEQSSAEHRAEKAEGENKGGQSSGSQDTSAAEPATKKLKTEAAPSNASEGSKTAPQVEGGGPRNKAPPATTAEETKKGGLEVEWKGGPGKYGLMREPKARADMPAALVHVGGMRDPHKAVGKIPTVQMLGKKLWARWTNFVEKMPEALKVAENYGTPDCQFDPAVLQAWEDELREEWEVETKPPTLTEAGVYKTPVKEEILRAWVRKSGDPESEVCDWLKDGTPLGIELPIKRTGVFPPMEGNKDAGPQSYVIADAVLERPETLKNYKSVDEDLEGAEMELQRYEEANYMRRVPLEEAQRAYAGGTTSRLGLVTKTKESGEVKRRIVIDLRRSGGNQLSELPERLVLPRAIDAIKMMKDIRKRADRAVESVETNVLELAVVDIQDAFTVLPVAKAELRHTLAPSTREGEVLMFQALLFGYKVAPLLYSRFAALLARLLQSAVDLSRGGHQVYLDDSVWALQGTVEERTVTLAFILTTMASLGVKVSLGKGTRAHSVTWIGIKLTLVDQDTLVLGLPEKFLDEMLGVLGPWEKMGYAPLKELRSIAGKNAWLSGVLPRARWATAVLYAVLTQTLKEEEEASKKEDKEDKKPKKGLFAVKRLELARIWLCQYLQAAKTRVMRRVHLGRSPGADIRITTDASPEALGGILVVNNKILAACFYTLEEKDAQELLVEYKTSSSQSVMEALAILVCLRRWGPRIKGNGVTLAVQADSVTALALTQRLGAKASSPGLNFIGAELSLCLEEHGIEEVRPVHLPGKANVEADFLSRPSTWSSTSMPEALSGVDISPDHGPTEGFYRLPTPKMAPSLWGVKAEAAGNASIWDSVV